MLPSPHESIRPAVALLLVGLIVQACGEKFEYELYGEPASAQPGATESTDGSWKAVVGELLLPLIAYHDTEYAQGYSEEAFRSLDLGSGTTAVEKVLGPPLEIKEYPGGEIYWYYSRHGKRYENYFVRILVFDGEVSLVARRAYFYLD